ncbi:MAG: SHOCT domain-containing protein [Solirubrobacterales bacterium]
MPGLLRGVARTAVIAGTATHVSNNVSRRQANRWAEQEQPQPGYMAPVQPQEAAPAPPAAEDPIEKLKEFAQLRDQGILTEEEFAAQKAKLLG